MNRKEGSGGTNAKTVARGTRPKLAAELVASEGTSPNPPAEPFFSEGASPSPAAEPAASEDIPPGSPTEAVFAGGAPPSSPAEGSTHSRVRLEASWKAALAAEFEKGYMRRLRAFLQREKQARKVIYPRGDHIFHALDLAPLPEVKVVIIGQDPYHGPRQAHGLCFSVRSGVRPPPSLENIFKEINEDLGGPGRRLDGSRGCLAPWARQGVLLLNAVLTVERGRAASHQGQGWEEFTDEVVKVLNTRREGLVFMLWGGYAQRKGGIVDRRRHCVLTAPHPSPLSASRGFFGCRHFSRANAYLQSRGVVAIDWFDVG